MDRPKRIAILGSTGSIGKQALDIINKYPDRFSMEVLTAGSNKALLISQAKKFLPKIVVIANKNCYKEVKDALSGLPVEVLAGVNEIENVAVNSDAELILAAMVGYAGMKPVLSAVKTGKDIALANKETLVVAGELITREASKSGSRIIPVDSEHSALFQCMVGENRKAVEKLILTASGGPFLNYTYEQLLYVTPEQALKHPRWDMGSKITIDSATLMNKGLEVIEAKWLFDIDPERIDVVIHPQSIIHSLVYFHDGSVKAQLGLPDMRIPILYALGFPERIPSDLPRLDLTELSLLTFRKPDITLFHNLPLAYEALKIGGNMPCIMNAANEVAVKSFLEGRTGFLQISDIVEYAMAKTTFVQEINLEILESADFESREIAKNYITNNLQLKR
ncbi:MAG TPA: 1-deoxy-D-xylulose-5-phosphate reductoisomerase [Bacteroidales bacterium]|nr:1-deoxy-D-xylulose-5-phosphate reductoisomerase [Bacteroidales bacterium]HQG36985.1 1-deoxy-D-xylulose-5-phosphate reductoisomerase [Bacteroidales bacterium]HQG52629.1 1-deoxy-D-xylulose-5-phosphate reductoisomerase [Bacteroidales bacterium]HQJ20365.1 1-deoxy-D-xylulose-5-phosphate reductoisomerase [Bacteroidales bacterium]HRC88911.1 1-deoxy-D-xylulose-5-phosphate reductoisomerase [Bacteroidales bacterium]